MPATPGRAEALLPARICRPSAGGARILGRSFRRRVRASIPPQFLLRDFSLMIVRDERMQKNHFVLSVVPSFYQPPVDHRAHSEIPATSEYACAQQNLAG